MTEENKVTEEVKEENKEVKKEKKEKKDAKYEKLREEVSRLERELKAKNDEYLKEIAEMQTTKRRLKEASINERKYASMNVVSELIEPIDMLLKIVNSKAPSEEINNYLIGFQMIANQLLQVLEREGLKTIPCSELDDFNPDLMQAVTSLEKEELDKPTVTKVLKTGYMYKDRVIKPTMVEVAVPVKKEENKETKEEIEEKEGED